MGSSNLKRSETGCFASHLACMEESLNDDDYLAISEDDTIFSKRTEAMVHQAMDQLRSTDWDLLYTDVDVFGYEAMHDCFDRCEKLALTNTIFLYNLRNREYYCASFYIINKASKRKVFEACSAVPIRKTYDCLLGAKVYDGTLNAYVIFPFATSVSPLCTKSQIQDPNNLFWTIPHLAFRQLVWIDGTPEAATKTCELIPPESLDKRSIAFSKIIQILATRHSKITQILAARPNSTLPTIQT